MDIAVATAKGIRERARRGLLSATPERMAKEGEPLRVISTTDPKTGEVLETQVLTASVLERLYGARALGRNPDEARARFDVGERLYAHWFYGRLFPLGSRDYRLPYAGNSTSFPIMPQSERQAHHRFSWRQADACLGGDRIAIVTRAIVIEEKDPTSVGLIVTSRRDKAQARAVAIEYLIDGLDRLLKLWA